MNRKFLLFIIFSTLLCCTNINAQQKETLWQRAETAATAGKYKEAFELLRDFEHAVATDRKLDAKGKAAERYKAARSRLKMYTRMRKPTNASEQLEKMERQANASADKAVLNDLLYNKAIFYYTFGQTDKGDVVFKEMTAQLTASKEYDKVDEVYQTLIANGRKSGNASMVAQAYNAYMVWKDSVNALKAAEEVNALNQKIQAGEASIAEKDSSLASRGYIITVLCSLLVILAIVLAGGFLLLMRYILLTRKQKKNIQLLNESIALKAKFTSNISAQLMPALQKLDGRQPEVKALVDFTNHIQTLSQIEATMNEPVEKEEISLPALCEGIMDQIRGKVKSGVVLNSDVPKTSVAFNREYVSHILLHLLTRAAEYTPEDGHIRLEFKKRSVHKYQFLVSNTGPVIPEEMRENIFLPFREVRDLTTDDGLGLPICRQMAVKMDGDLCIDAEFTKGTRFVLSINA